jgi:hypothetical protein
VFLVVEFFVCFFVLCPTLPTIDQAGEFHRQTISKRCTDGKQREVRWFNDAFSTTEGIRLEALPMDCYLDVVGKLVPLRFEEGRPRAVRNKVAGKGQQQNYWTEAVQVTKTNDRPDLSSEGAPYIDKTVNVKHKLIYGHETQMGLETTTDWPTGRRS